MNINLQCVKKACDNLGLSYELCHKDKIILKIKLSSGTRYFINHIPGLNRNDLVRICRDKDISYTLLKEVINIPKWKSYLAPNCNEHYQKMLRFQNNNLIAKDIRGSFDYPLIVKKNRGSIGCNVFLCKANNQVESAIEKIFDRGSSKYDYVALAQEYIEPKKEYRVIVYNKNILLVYEKSTKGAMFRGNLSPLHWEGAKAVRVDDKGIKQRLKDFIYPFFNVIPLEFGGLDIIEDEKGGLWLLELNHSPGFGLFIKDNGLGDIVKLYEDILRDLNENKKVS